MDKVSIIIPSRNEEYLNHTVKDLLKKAEGEIEIVVVLDGNKADPPLPEDSRIKTIFNEEPKGMRNAINSAAKMATGKYLMKCDAHCAFDQGFDVKLKTDCEPDWTVVPRRYDIDKREWDRHQNRELYYDFQYISSPDDKQYTFKGVDWPEYNVRVKDQMIVDLMTSQGSCWFMHKKFFTDTLGYLDDVNYGTMGAEAQEVCLKTWLSGGRYVLNRKTWYAHKKKRTGVKHYGYKKPGSEWKKSRKYAIKCWTNNEWPGQVKKLEWLVKKFKPVPGWHTKEEPLRTERFVQARYKLNRGGGDYPKVIKGLNRKGLTILWRDLGYKLGCEVGIAKGFMSYLMFKNIPDLKMYLIDPFRDYAGLVKYGSKHIVAKEVAKRRMKGYNAVWMEEMSDTAFTKIKNRSLDFVYIDGNHKYDFVMLDIILWSRKVRQGGMICGHDYNTNRPSSICEVKEAVDDYTRIHKIIPFYITDSSARQYHSDRHSSWFWIKKGI